jgi:hypothetical protein
MGHIICEQHFSFFQICIYFISFSCLITLARSPSIFVKTIGEKGQLCIVPDLGEKASSFSLLTMMLIHAGFFVQLVGLGFFLFLRYSLSS